MVLVRDVPAEMPGITATELPEIRAVRSRGGTEGRVPWRRLFALPQFWLIVIAISATRGELVLLMAGSRPG